MLKESGNLTEELVVLTERGELRLIQVAQAAALVSELIYSNACLMNRSIPAEGVAALLGCFAEQLEGAISESSRISGRQ